MLLGFVIISIFFPWAIDAQDTCGFKPPQPEWNETEPESYIVGGRDAVGAGYWPWQISLQYLSNTTGEFGHTCGASLIRPQWAMTAAHCVESKLIGSPENPGREDPTRFRLVLGAHNISGVTNEQIINIDLIAKHDRWVPNPYLGFPNDIALLRMVEPADLSDPRVELGCLPKDREFNFTGNPNCWITGWGKTRFLDDFIPDILQEALVSIPSNEECLEAHLGYIRDSHICAGDGYPNACSGDSGGPMSCLAEDNNWYVAGLTSWGIAGCKGLPAVYTRTSSFWEWIDLTIALNAPPE